MPDPELVVRRVSEISYVATLGDVEVGWGIAGSVRRGAGRSTGRSRHLRSRGGGSPPGSRGSSSTPPMRQGSPSSRAAGTSMDSWRDRHRATTTCAWVIVRRLPARGTRAGSPPRSCRGRLTCAEPLGGVGRCGVRRPRAVQLDTPSWSAGVLLHQGELGRTSPVRSVPGHVRLRSSDLPSLPVPIRWTIAGMRSPNEARSHVAAARAAVAVRSPPTWARPRQHRR